LILRSGTGDSTSLYLHDMQGLNGESVWKLGVDVGGTFTDAVLYNEVTGQTFKAKVISMLCTDHRKWCSEYAIKVPSTVHDQSQGVSNAINCLR